MTQTLILYDRRNREYEQVPIVTEELRRGIDESDRLIRRLNEVRYELANAANIFASLENLGPTGDTPPVPPGANPFRPVPRDEFKAILKKAEGLHDQLIDIDTANQAEARRIWELPAAPPAAGPPGAEGRGMPHHMRRGAGMVGGANSYYHSDTETFVHVTIGKQPLKLEAGRPIWVTRSTDPHAPMRHKADEDLYPHYFKLVKKAKLFLLSGAHGKFTDSIKRELHDFINQRPNDKDKADLKEELEEVFDDAAYRGIWTTDAGADYRLVLFMRKILPKDYDGFVRDINPYPVTETEICFFDQTILREIPRPPGDSKAQASLRQGMRDAAKEEVATRQAARAAFSVQMKKARDEAALAVLDAQDRGEAAPAAPDAAPAAVIAPPPGSGGAGDGEGVVKRGEGIPHHMRRGGYWQAGVNRRR